jgi:asparagine N-glycosylation enzyme membrane subunit Stt3
VEVAPRSDDTPAYGTRFAKLILVRNQAFAQLLRLGLSRHEKRRTKVMGLILVIVLVLLLLGVVPRWPHSRNWGYGPSGGLGLLLIIVLILWLLGVF